MRIGQNPVKKMQTVAKPKRITVAILNHIPFLNGFYAEMQDVLNLCLESARKDAGLDFDLMVFDNGSCREVQESLLDRQKNGEIQYLFISEKNLGKGGAWNIIFDAAPGEIISFADNDVLFSPNWLKRSVEILENYPRVGMVTARPFRTNPDFYSSTLQWAGRDTQAHLEKGTLLPWNTFLEFNLSLGAEEEEILQKYNSTEDIRVTFHNIHAYLGSSHWQFTSYKKVLGEFLPIQMDKPMGEVKKLDQMVNDAGYLRLMISDPLAMNMSNTVPLNYRGEANELPKSRRNTGKKFVNLAFIRIPLLKIYDLIFRLYYEN
jgi:glycosyltransferase involved in cell wall biosynthesis